MAEQPREKVTNAILAKLQEYYEKAQWQPFFDILGLNEESSKNLLRLLVIHLLLDHLLNVRLAQALIENRTGADFDGIIKELAGVKTPKRIALAVKLGAISSETSRQLTEVNKVRNACVHYRPKPRGNFEAIPEIATKDAFEACSKKGFAALKKLLELLRTHAATGGR